MFGRPRTPVEPAHYHVLDVQARRAARRRRRRTPTAGHCATAPGYSENRRAEPAEVRDDDPIARIDQNRRDRRQSCGCRRASRAAAAPRARLRGPTSATPTLRFPASICVIGPRGAGRVRGGSGGVSMDMAVYVPSTATDRNAARISWEKSVGCSRAAKWPPRRAG